LQDLEDQLVALVAVLAGQDLEALERRRVERGEPVLLQVLALLVGVRDLARLVALEEQHLGDPLVGVDLGRQRRRVRDLERGRALPTRARTASR
jgi:hypothetical protein